PLSEIVNRATDVDGANFALARLPNRSDQGVEGICSALDRPEPTLVEPCLQHFVHHGVAQRLLAGEVVIQRALSHARLADDRVETGRLETPPINLMEARPQEALPRPVGVTRRLYIHTDQYEC